MTAARLVLASAVLLAGGLVLGLFAGPAADPQPPAKPAPPAAEPPGGAVLIGTAQFRHVGWHSRVFLADDGKTLLVVGEGDSVRWWDVETGTSLHEMRLKGNFHGAAFAPDGNFLAVTGTHWPNGETGDSEHVLWLIDTTGRKLVRTVGLPGGRGPQKVRVSADGRRVFVEHEGDVRVIDGKTGDELIRHKGRINATTLTVSADGKLVLFGRGEMYLWRWETGEEPKKVAAVGGFLTESLQFAPDGKTLYVADDRSGVIVTWDVATGRQTGTISLGPAPDVLSVSPDGRTLAASCADTKGDREAGSSIRLLDLATGNEVRRLPVGRDRLSHAGWSRDGSRLAAVSDYQAWVWDVKTGKLLGPARPRGADRGDGVRPGRDAVHRQRRPHDPLVGRGRGAGAGVAARLLGARPGGVARRLARRRVVAQERPADLGCEVGQAPVQAPGQREDGRHAAGPVHPRRHAADRLGRRRVRPGVGRPQRQAARRAHDPAGRREDRRG